MRAKVVYPNTPPDPEPRLSMFLAGGITNAPDWQSEFIEMLGDLPLVLFNPRHPKYEWTDETHKSQVTWERVHLHRADMISFWFPQEAPCMITLFELGYWLSQSTNPHVPVTHKRKLFVGCHKGYSKCRTVEVQIELAAPELVIASSLEALSSQVHDFVGDWK